ncbi:NAD(P)-dependent dehydrogenase (short-subunit alcohol dehydrogenase family) [Novosphingobium capsulatum]|uniref:NAD(P)-dependent dehydrogenase (Short-subunit alcohol dehydrogenase family) n=2 Tax=Sphingomonadaceae TaxID=41297 RepID=A0ABU1MMD4_9SPHN|nr:NAD(P)-dependent dehydrogenase (short-subunit alcohol dehydrogenase family) [Novosphingobium sp. BK256]MBB3374426.1 NAD(P)-dependent dehydrogenase (short-subunit alcohol dehydrogenase family) [Novosphingobium sp. BK280]MBB3378838.1 NAD(P)-dependent dehydrogenase (short-subunit alcohol dehydrogenase family) [Novosphingobium sp. BK258]MBB3420532.1 NAD(P)-dependent dehydrogenase (short-subunit alcohol dehydrogenase family) [Novosphingobium sp. BK267]MBB3448346.1 NAD(P)-dependent dehydrogenase (
MTMARLHGRIALVTGGLRGIGLAIATRLASEGAAVTISDLDAPDSAAVAQALAALGSDAAYLRADVTSEADWASIAAQMEAKGGCHILVNNAGTDLTGAVETLSLDAWRKIMAINVDGVFLGTRALVPLMARSGAEVAGGASIINVSSIMGLVGYSEVSAYNASKGAVRLFTKGIAVEFAQKRMPIRANSLHPGFVRTPLLNAGFQRWVDKGFAEKPEDLVAAMEAATPNGRLAEPEELAGPAAFLASADASYMTGAELVIDGGWTAQ